MFLPRSKSYWGMIALFVTIQCEDGWNLKRKKKRHSHPEERVAKVLLNCVKEAWAARICVWTDDVLGAMEAGGALWTFPTACIWSKYWIPLWIKVRLLEGPYTSLSILVRFEFAASVKPMTWFSGTSPEDKPSFVCKIHPKYYYCLKSWKIMLIIRFLTNNQERIIQSVIHTLSKLGDVVNNLRE